MAADDDEVMKAAIADYMVVNKVVKDFQKNDKLSPIHSVVLQFLGLSKAGATPGHIAMEYNFTADYTAKVLKALREHLFVQPIADDKDGRVKHYYLTSKGAVEVASALLARGFHIEPKHLPHVKAVKPEIRRS